MCQLCALAQRQSRRRRSFKQGCHHCECRTAHCKLTVLSTAYSLEVVSPKIAFPPECLNVCARAAGARPYLEIDSRLEYDSWIVSPPFIITIIVIRWEWFPLTTRIAFIAVTVWPHHSICVLPPDSVPAPSPRSPLLVDRSTSRRLVLSPCA